MVGSASAQVSDQRSWAADLRELYSYRQFRLVWFGWNLSRLGDSVYEIAIAWTVYRLTGSALAMGGVLAAYTLPQVLLNLFGGALGDCWNRRSILLITDAIAGTVTSTLGVLLATGHLSMVVIFAASALLGAVSAFSSPAQGPLYADLLPESVMRQAVAIDSATFSAATLVGPALGGVLAAWSPAGAMALDGASFLSSFACMYLVRVTTCGRRLDSLRSGCVTCGTGGPTASAPAGSYG